MTDIDGQWIAVADASIEPGQVVADDEHDVVVWRTVDGRPCVMDSRCPHQWSHLAAEGVVDGDELVCTAHFWRFRTDGTGSKLSMGGRRDEKSSVDVFPCREEGGRIVALVTRAALVALLAVAALLLPAALLPATSAGAQSGTEAIRSFDVEMDVQSDGSLIVRETIQYDFGFTSRHGIERYIPVRFPYDGEGPDEGVSYERITPIEDVTVSSATAPSDVEESEENDNLKLRIGDPDRTITGAHTYQITYRIRGVFNSFEDHDELFYNVTGNGWNVPINSVAARVTSPVEPTQTACFAGPAGSRLECTSQTVDGTVSTFTQTGLGAHEGLTIVEALPPGTVDAAPILDEVWSPGRAFEATPLTMGGGLGLLLIGGGLVGWMLWEHGRDRRFRGSATDAAFAETGEEEKAPLRGGHIDPVEFVPPEGIRPGHMGTLYDEVANPLDVSAMIIDLAVRGYLRIEEVEAPSQGGAFGFGKTEGDYRFVKVKAADSELLPSETVLLAALFRDDDAPVLSDLRTKFAARLALVQGALYDDAVAASWFPSRPDRVRAKWRILGLVVLVVGVGLVVLAAWRTRLGLVALPIPLLGLAIVALADRFPRRTSRGTAMLGRIRGFKELFDVGEGDRQRFVESKQLFSQYLPYAIVFGMAERWAQTFESLGLTPEEMGVGTWYVSPYGYHPLTFAYAMSSFSTVTTGSIAAAAPSSSAAGGSSGFSGGGFSGGGFGGGGGGSW